MAEVASSSKKALENSSHVKTTATDISKDETSAGNSQPSKKRKKTGKKLKREILKYEKRMKQLHEQIKKFQEADLSVEDMDGEDSVYIRTDYLMQRLVRTWEEWCHLTGNSPQIVVSTAEAKDYAGTEFEELNKKVQKLLDGDEFPDYQDVHELVEHCNSNHSLGLSKEKEQETSRSLFKDVGKLMKKKRRQDFLNHFGCHLTDAVHLTDDPALKDETLSSTLAGIDRRAESQMERIMEEFVSKQNTRQQSSSSSEGEGEEEDGVEGEQGTPAEFSTLDEVDDTTSGRNSGDSASEENGDNPSDQEEEEEEEETTDTRARNDERGDLDIDDVPLENETGKAVTPSNSCPSSPEVIVHAVPRDLPLKGSHTVGKADTEDKCINLHGGVRNADAAEVSSVPKRRKVESTDVIILDDA